MKRKRPSRKPRTKARPAKAPRGHLLTGTPEMKCQKMLHAINDYVDGKLDPAICSDFESHLAGCDPCQIVVDNVRRTITLYKAGEPYAMPGGCHKRLHRMLADRWKANFE